MCMFTLVVEVYICKCCTVRFIHPMYVTVHGCRNGKRYCTMRVVCVYDIASPAAQAWDVMRTRWENARGMCHYIPFRDLVLC